MDGMVETLHHAAVASVMELCSFTMCDPGKGPFHFFGLEPVSANKIYCDDVISATIHKPQKHLCKACATWEQFTLCLAELVVDNPTFGVLHTHLRWLEFSIYISLLQSYS